MLERFGVVRTEDFTVVAASISDSSDRTRVAMMDTGLTGSSEVLAKTARAKITAKRKAVMGRPAVTRNHALPRKTAS